MSDVTLPSPKPARAYPRWLIGAWLAALLAVPFILWWLPADHFDEGESMCPSVLLFDVECHGCGSTRAVQHMHHFEWEEALYFHSLAPVIYVGLIALWTWWTYHAATRMGLFGQARAEAMEAQLKGEVEARIARKAAKAAARS